MKNIFTCVVMAGLLAASTAWAAKKLTIQAVGLTCEYRDNPLGIDALTPQLGWRLAAEDESSGASSQNPRGIKQTAYQVLVASTPQLLAKAQGDLWDSGKVEAGQGSSAIYAGSALKARQQCYWKVRVWTESGHATDWSQPAFWIMGVMEDWRGSWIASRDVPMNPPKGQKFIPAPGQHGNFIQQSQDLGFHARIASQADTVKWVQVDLGGPKPIQGIRIRTLNHDKVAGFGFPLRYRLEVSDEASFAQPRTIEDCTAADRPNPGETWLTVDGKGVTGRYVRLTATKLFARPSKPAEFCFGLRRLEVISEGKNVALNAPVEALDTVEAHGWNKSLLTKSFFDLTPRKEAVLLRREVKLNHKPVRAMARVTALGFVDFLINGQKVGDRAMAPALSDCTKRVYYDTYDVTELLRTGENTFGAVLGNGYFSTPGRGWGKWYGVGNEPVVSIEVELTMPDGTQSYIGTDQ